MFRMTFTFLLQLVILVYSRSVVVSLSIWVNFSCPEFEVFFHEHILEVF